MNMRQWRLRIAKCGRGNELFRNLHSEVRISFLSVSSVHSCSQLRTANFKNAEVILEHSLKIAQVIAVAILSHSNARLVGSCDTSANFS